MRNLDEVLKMKSDLYIIPQVKNIKGIFTWQITFLNSWMKHENVIFGYLIKTMYLVNNKIS